MSFLTLKALHIVSVVAWFAGLFYIVRLFVYIAEAHDRPADEAAILLPQLKLMASRLWFGITWPAGIATLVFGGMMVPMFWPAQWLQIKLGLVFGLVIYHGICHWIHARLQADVVVMSSLQLRFWNEVATLFLVGIVFVVVLKDALALVWAVGGFVVFSAVLMVGITAYRKLRSA